MGFELCDDASAADWLVANDVDPHFAAIGADAAAVALILADRRIDTVFDDPAREPPYWS